MASNNDEVLSLIPTGKEQAISAAALVARAQLPDERTLRIVIAKARAEGELICSGASGYYRPETYEEVFKYVQMMERHAKSTFIAARSARAKLKEMAGQVYIENMFTEDPERPPADLPAE